MIAGWALALWTVAAGAGELDCSAVTPADAPDPDAARAYLDVGDAEERQGRADTAAVAFREAIRLDPSNAAARARLLELCREDGQAPDEDFERAAQAVEDGRYEEALALLGPRYGARHPPEPAVALLYGISLYERGDDAGAKAALDAAARSPQTADAANVFLGLLALRSGDSERAAAQFERVNQGQGAQGEWARTARDLSALARRNSRLAVSVQAEGGYDTNVDQYPDSTPGADFSGDLLYGGTASALLRPWGENGPYAMAGTRLRNFPDIGEYDLGWAGGAAGYRLQRGLNALRLEYAYDAIWLGFEPFMSAHQLQVDGKLELPFARVGGMASARLETYEADATAKYSGPTYDGEAALGWGGGRVELWLRYRGEWHDAAEADVSWLDHGPGLRAFTAFLSGRLVVDAQVTVRTYGAADPGLGLGNVVRQDEYLDGAVSLEQDLSQQWCFYLSLGGRKAFSSVPRLGYTRLYGSAGVIFTAGLW